MAIFEFAETYFRDVKVNKAKIGNPKEERLKDELLNDAFKILKSDITDGTKENFLSRDFLPYYTKNCIVAHNHGYIGNP